MSKFCQNCGNMLDDTAAFCDRCGKPFETEASAAPQVEAPAAPAVSQPQATAAPQYTAPEYTAPQPQYTAAPEYTAPQPQYAAAPQYGAPQYGTTAVEEKKGFLTFVKEKKILLIVIAAVLVVAIALIIILPPMFSNNAEGALTKAFDCAKNLDIRGAADLSYEQNFDQNADKEAEIKEAESQLEAYGSMLDMVKNMMKDAKLEIKKNEQITGDDLEDLKKDWSSSYKDTDKIEEVRQLTYVIKGISMFGVSSDDSENTCYVVKVGGKWYVKDMGSLGAL